MKITPTHNKRKRYYALDDIGFVGTQEKRSARQVRRDKEEAEEFIRKQTSSGPRSRKSISR